MSTPLFGEDDRPEQAARLRPLLRAQAAKGVYWGTSSWKYEGWLGSIYSPSRYVTRGKHSAKKFDETCLAEYAEVFPTVCGDFAFYQFPTVEYWAKLFAATPEEFFIGLKVPEDVTVARWPSHARYGKKAGLDNEHFLDADILTRLFLKRLEPHSHKVGCLIFEFGTFNKSAFATPEDFHDALGGFLGDLPQGPRYSVEIRNPEYLSPAYFKVLADHNVAHVFNAWTRMPTLDDQVRIPEAFTADFVVARALLRKGRSYEDAVKSFEPYDRTQEPNESARTGLRAIAEKAMESNRLTYLYVNNRLEGNAPSTIEAVAASLSIAD